MSTRGQAGQQKKAFLAAFAAIGVVLTAAKQAGVARSTVYAWLERDEAFSVAYHQAEKDACDVLVQAAVRRAVQGVPHETRQYDRAGKLIDTSVETKYSDSLLMFLIKKRDPSYREASKVQLEHSGPDGGPIRTRTEHADAFDYDAYRRLFSEHAGGLVAAPAAPDGADQSLDSPLSDR